MDRWMGDYSRILLGRVGARLAWPTGCAAGGHKAKAASRPRPHPQADMRGAHRVLAGQRRVRGRLRAEVDAGAAHHCLARRWGAEEAALSMSNLQLTILLLYFLLRFRRQ